MKKHAHRASCIPEPAFRSPHIFPVPRTDSQPFHQLPDAEKSGHKKAAPETEAAWH
jgi:hypothetical protein